MPSLSAPHLSSGADQDKKAVDHLLTPGRTWIDGYTDIIKGLPVDQRARSLIVFPAAKTTPVLFSPTDAYVHIVNALVNHRDLGDAATADSSKAKKSLRHRSGEFMPGGFMPRSLDSTQLLQRVHRQCFPRPFRSTGHSERLEHSRHADDPLRAKKVITPARWKIFASHVLNLATWEHLHRGHIPGISHLCSQLLLYASHNAFRGGAIEQTRHGLTCGPDQQGAEQRGEDSSASVQTTGSGYGDHDQASAIFDHLTSAGLNQLSGGDDQCIEFDLLRRRCYELAQVMTKIEALMSQHGYQLAEQDIIRRWRDLMRCKEQGGVRESLEDFVQQYSRIDFLGFVACSPPERWLIEKLSQFDHVYVHAIHGPANHQQEDQQEELLSLIGPLGPDQPGVPHQPQVTLEKKICSTAQGDEYAAYRGSLGAAATQALGQTSPLWLGQQLHLPANKDAPSSPSTQESRAHKSQVRLDKQRRSASDQPPITDDVVQKSRGPGLIKRRMYAQSTRVSEWQRSLELAREYIEYGLSPHRIAILLPRNASMFYGAYLAQHQGFHHSPGDELENSIDKTAGNRGGNPTGRRHIDSSSSGMDVPPSPLQPLQLSLPLTLATCGLAVIVKAFGVFERSVKGPRDYYRLLTTPGLWETLMTCYLSDLKATSDERYGPKIKQQIYKSKKNHGKFQESLATLIAAYSADSQIPLRHLQCFLASHRQVLCSTNTSSQVVEKSINRIDKHRDDKQNTQSHKSKEDERLGYRADWVMAWDFCLWCYRWFLSEGLFYSPAPQKKHRHNDSHKKGTQSSSPVSSSLSLGLSPALSQFLSEHSSLLSLSLPGPNRPLPQTPQSYHRQDLNRCGGNNHHSPSHYATASTSGDNHGMPARDVSTSASSKLFLACERLLKYISKHRSRWARSSLSSETHRSLSQGAWRSDGLYGALASESTIMEALEDMFSDIRSIDHFAGSSLPPAQFWDLILSALPNYTLTMPRQPLRGVQVLSWHKGCMMPFDAVIVCGCERGGLHPVKSPSEDLINLYWQRRLALLSPYTEAQLEELCFTMVWHSVPHQVYLYTREHENIEPAEFLQARVSIRGAFTHIDLQGDADLMSRVRNEAGSNSGSDAGSDHCLSQRGYLGSVGETIDDAPSSTSPPGEDKVLDKTKCQTPSNPPNTKANTVKESAEKTNHERAIPQAFLPFTSSPDVNDEHSLLDRVSASSLKKMIQCPYSYMISQSTSLEGSILKAPADLQTGQWLHRAAEIFITGAEFNSSPRLTSLMTSFPPLSAQGDLSAKSLTGRLLRIAQLLAQHHPETLLSASDYYQFHALGAPVLGQWFSGVIKTLGWPEKIECEKDLASEELFFGSVNSSPSSPESSSVEPHEMTDQKTSNHLSTGMTELRGKIDLLIQTQKLTIIVDYKSRSLPKAKDIREGKEPQLFLYSSAAAGCDRDDVATLYMSLLTGGILLVSLPERFIGTKVHSALLGQDLGTCGPRELKNLPGPVVGSTEQFNKIYDQILATWLMRRSKIAESGGKFLAYKGQQCRWCSFQQICRLSDPLYEKLILPETS